MIADKAESIMLSKWCIYCNGTGQLGMATAANPSQYNGGNNVVDCPSCVRGFVFIAMDKPQFMKWISDQMLMMLFPRLEQQLMSGALFPDFVRQLKEGPLRPQFFDLIVAEVEQRLKDVESKILDAKVVKKPQAWKTGSRCFAESSTAPGKTLGTVRELRLSSDPPGKVILDIDMDDGNKVSKFTDEVDPIEKDANGNEVRIPF